MTDERFLAALEACRLAPAEFGHREHVRAAFLYLERLPFGAAIDAMSASLRRYVAALGRADRYHETVTVAFMALVNASRLEQGGEDWPAFAARNPHLLNARLLDDYYSGATLAAEYARRRFVLERRPTGSGSSGPGRAPFGY